jgi:hypothetical protein
MESIDDGLAAGVVPELRVEGGMESFEFALDQAQDFCGRERAPSLHIGRRWLNHGLYTHVLKSA